MTNAEIQEDFMTGCRNLIVGVVAGVFTIGLIVAILGVVGNGVSMIIDKISFVGSWLPQYSVHIANEAFPEKAIRGLCFLGHILGLTFLCGLVTFMLWWLGHDVLQNITSWKEKRYAP